jgi:hypothetical protein
MTNSTVRHLLIAILRSIALWFLLATVFPFATAVDSKQLADADALIARAKKLSSLTQAGSIAFFVQAEISHAASKLTGSTGVYELWWAADDRWREEVDADNLKGLQIRNSEGLWVPPDLDPKLATIFADGQGFPFRGDLLRWNEEIVGLKERKVEGLRLSCVEVESPDLQRELCFDPKTGLLDQTTSEVKLERWQFIAFEPDTSTAVPITNGKEGGQYLGEVPSTDTIEFVTKYANYSTIGNKIVPGEIRRNVKGRVIIIWKLIRIAPDPKPPFTPASLGSISISLR